MSFLFFNYYWFFKNVNLLSILNLNCKIIPFIYTIYTGKKDSLNDFVFEGKGLTAVVKADFKW